MLTVSLTINWLSDQPCGTRERTFGRIEPVSRFWLHAISKVQAGDPRGFGTIATAVKSALSYHYATTVAWCGGREPHSRKKSPAKDEVLAGLEVDVDGFALPPRFLLGLFRFLGLLGFRLFR
jgi:hypothetical protein